MVSITNTWMLPEARPATSANPQRTHAARADAVEEALDRADHRKATALLVERYAGELLRFCAPRCGHAAEDVVQTVFEQVLRDITSFSRNVPVRAWLFGIAHHRCLDHLRATRARDERTTGEEEAAELAPESDLWARVDGALDEPARLQLLTQLMRRLDDEVWFAIALRYLVGLTYPEMAEVCGQPQATLRQRVTRGLASLQKMLTDMEIER